MLPLTIRLFGRFDVCHGDQPSDVLNARRAREVFSYLVLHRDQPQRRETLADILWEDAAPEQSRKYLRQALWQIQTALRPHCASDGAQLLGVDPEWIQLNNCEQITVDVTRFKDAINGCHGISGPKLGDAGLQCLEDAVALYRGDLLDGWCQDWCLFERERLQNDFLDALEKLVCSCEARSDSERGLAHAKRMLAVDPAREQVHRHIMRLHLLAGNRTAALRAYQRCEKVLMEELGVKPSQLTRGLYESIRDGDVDSPWPDLNAISIAAESPRLQHDQLPALADLLSRVQHLFAGIETRLRQDIAAANAPRSERD